MPEVCRAAHRKEVSIMLTDEQINLMGQLTEANEELQGLNGVIDDDISDCEEEIAELNRQIKDAQDDIKNYTDEIKRLQKKKGGADKERKKIEARITAIQNKLTTSFGAVVVAKDLSKSPLSLKQKVGRKFR
jgi:chromosome segregation ATPase